VHRIQQKTWSRIELVIGKPKESRPMPGYSTDKDKGMSRLRRIEGQVRGLQRMVDEDQ
jgi:hypothetical protein